MHSVALEDCATGFPSHGTGLAMRSRVVRLLMVGCMPPLHGDNVGIVEIVAHTKATIIPSRPYRGRSLDMSQQVSTLKCL